MSTGKPSYHQPEYYPSAPQHFVMEEYRYRCQKSNKGLIFVRREALLEKNDKKGTLSALRDKCQTIMGIPHEILDILGTNPFLGLKNT